MLSMALAKPVGNDSSTFNSKPKRDLDDDTPFYILEAAQIVEILNRKPAFLSGGLDKTGAPIISVVNHEGSSKGDLRDLFSYLGAIPNEGLRSKGLTFVVDKKSHSIEDNKIVLEAIQASTISKRVTTVHVLRKDGFKEKHRAAELNRNNLQYDFQVLFVTQQKLYKYVHPFQLTEEFGGSFLYSHEQWLKKRLAVERYLKECSSMSKHIESCYNILSLRSAEFDKVTASRKLLGVSEFYRTNAALPSKVLLNGEELLVMLSTDLDTGFRHTADKAHLDANGQSQDQVQQTMSHLKNLQNRFHELWLEKEHRLKELAELYDLENQIEMVIMWIRDEGGTKLPLRDIGSTQSMALAFLKEHESMELDCATVFVQYAQICHQVETMLKVGHSEPLSIRQGKKRIDAFCQRFAHCIEKRRNTLQNTVFLFSHSNQMLEKISNCKVQVEDFKKMGSLLECECALKMFSHWVESINMAWESTQKYGHLLIDLLQTPTTTSFGETVVKDCTRHLGNSKKLLDHCDHERRRFLDLMEVKELKVQQELQMFKCEQDAKQAVAWLDEICEHLAIKYVDIGRTESEIETARKEHQKCEETAKGCYEYGKKLLETALFLRNSFMYGKAANTRIEQLLENGWKKFTSGSQERTIRLSLVRTLFKTFEKLKFRIEELEEALEADLKTFGLVRKKWVCRKHRGRWNKIRTDIRQSSKAAESLEKRISKPVIDGYVGNDEIPPKDDGTLEEISRLIASMADKQEAMENRYFSDEALSCSSETQSYVTAKSNLSTSSSATLTGTTPKRPNHLPVPRNSLARPVKRLTDFRTNKNPFLDVLKNLIMLDTRRPIFV